MKTYLVRFTLPDSTNGYAIVTAKSVKDAQRIVINYGDNANLVYNIYSVEEFQLGIADKCCNPNTVLASGITTKGHDGKDGVGIKTIYGHQTSNTNYELTIRLTNGIVQTFNIELVDLTEQVNQNTQKITLLETKVNNLNGTNIPIDSSDGAQSITQTIVNNKQIVDAAIEELNQKIINLDLSIYIIADSLPETNIKYQKIYVVPSEQGKQGPYNTYTEWVRIPGNPDRWEKIGEFQTEIDLSNYWSKDEISVNTTDELLVINDGDKQWVAHLEELVQPEPVVISPTQIVVTTGNVKFDLETETEGASIIYKVKYENNEISSGGSANNYIQNASFNIDLNGSGFDSNGNKQYTVESTAIKNGLREDNIETLTVQRQLLMNEPVVTGNEYSTTRTVTLSSPTSGTTIYYTTNGSTPTTNSAVYNGPITLNNTSTVKAIAVKSNWANSEVVSTSVTVGTLKMYYTLVQVTPTTVEHIEAFTAVEKKALPVTVGPYTSSFGENGYGKVCFAYANPNRDLTSIKDNNGFEYIEDFVKTVVGSYRVYTMKDIADQKTIKYTFN